MHQIPPKPDYFRVKVWRRLQRLGAVALKNSVYVLPRGDQAAEDFQWVLREITTGGGDAAVCEARFVEGLSDAQVTGLFHQARDADYRPIAEEAGRLAEELPQGGPPSGERRARAEADLLRLRKRLAEVAAIDHLAAPGRRDAERGIAALDARLHAPPAGGRRPARRPGRAEEPVRAGRGRYRGRVWVTRKGVHVDRMASAWLIRRFVDPRARFKFVTPGRYRPARQEVRFDMFEAEFTHEGHKCTFEVLLDRLGLKDAALRPIAEIVHDIDLKDACFGREETAGIGRLIAGTAMAHRDDERRVERGAAVFDDLYEYFRRKLS
jgi:hypothetical protein